MMSIFQSIATLYVRTFPRNRTVWVELSTDPLVRVPGVSLFHHRSNGTIYVRTFHESPTGTMTRHGYYDVGQVTWRGKNE